VFPSFFRCCFVSQDIQFQQAAVVENKTTSKIKDDSRFQIFYKLRSSQVKENQDFVAATVSFLSLLKEKSHTSY